MRLGMEALFKEADVQALHERRTHRTAVDRETLPELWQTYAFRASRPMLVACVTLGTVGAAGLVALPMRWAWVSLMCIVGGMFGVHGLAVQHLPESVSSRVLAALKSLRFLADLVAAVAVLFAVLNL